MLNIIRRILKLSGEYRKNFIKAFIIAFFESILANVPIFMIMFALFSLLNGNLTTTTALYCGIGLVLGIIIRTTLRYFIEVNQTGVGYHIFARERMKLGDRLKRFQMGYFSEGNMGNINAVISNDMSFIEYYGIETMSKITSSMIGMIFALIFLTIFNPLMALILLVTVILFSIAFRVLQNIAQAEGRNQQEAEKNVVGTVIEYIKGMPVVKAFNLVGKNHKATSQDFKILSDVQLRFEQRFTFPIIVALVTLSLGTAALVATCGYLSITGSMELAFAISFSIFAFDVFLSLQVLTGVTGQIRITGAGLDRYEEVLKTKIIDENSKDIKLHKFDIEFNNVEFSYEEKNVLNNISFKVPEHSMTALVGKSGCGKTTIANLIARFWDTKSGSIKIGGVDIKKMTCESLLKNISMVFQDVYLFNDTIYNNVAFGKPSATSEEIKNACKKARCHDFIMALPNGYNTIVGEGGSSLSGGEKQRISIARCILKDAPIVLLDEATASIDPDNEAYIQQAISEMVKGKTLIVIAHKLSSILDADQILMIEDGKILERGKHDDLVSLNGSYAKLWNKRVNSNSWSI